jgi:hypothetical protein
MLGKKILPARASDGAPSSEPYACHWGGFHHQHSNHWRVLLTGYFGE